MVGLAGLALGHNPAVDISNNFPINDLTEMWFVGLKE